MEWVVPEECVGAASTCMNSFSPRGGGCDISKDADTGTCMSSFFFCFEKKRGNSRTQVLAQQVRPL